MEFVSCKLQSAFDKKNWSSSKIKASEVIIAAGQIAKLFLNFQVCSSAQLTYKEGG